KRARQGVSTYQDGFDRRRARRKGPCPPHRSNGLGWTRRRRGSMAADDLGAITDWLAAGARSAPTPQKLMGDLCERLVASGLPLWRVGGFVRKLQPNVFGRRFVW